MTEKQKDFMNQKFEAHPSWDKQWAHCFNELEDNGEIGKAQSFMLTWQIRAVIGALMLQEDLGKPIADMTPSDVVEWVKSNIPFDTEATGAVERRKMEKEQFDVLN